jgi:FkbM family methyltransferase
MLSLLKIRFKRWLYGSCPGFAGAFPYYGTKTYFPRNSLVFALACEQGIYESANVRLMLSALRPDTTAFDVGANIGLMSLPLLATEPTLKVVSVEPSPHNHTALLRTATASRYNQRWEIVTKALSDHEGEATFHCAAPGLGAFDSLVDTGRSGETSTIRVPLTTLDSLWEQRTRPAVSLIKIDVEGAELSTLRGAVGCLRMCRPVVLVEWNQGNLRSFDCAPESLLSFAAELDYDVFAMPSLVRITSGVHLHSLMQFDESFVLLPRSS